MLRLIVLLLLVHSTPAHAENTSRLQASKDFAFCSAFFLLHLFQPLMLTKGEERKALKTNPCLMHKFQLRWLTLSTLRPHWKTQRNI